MKWWNKHVFAFIFSFLRNLTGSSLFKNEYNPESSDKLHGTANILCWSYILYDLML